MSAAPRRAGLLVVAKAPVPGLVKTRLQTAMTPEEAAEVAAASLLDTLDAVAATPVASRVVALTGDLDAATRSAEVRAALREFVVVPQRGDGLGERLAAAHQDAHRGLPVVQIGMDTPQVTPGLLTTAVDRLLQPAVDAVLGPADDGGWWALGVTEPRYAAGLPGVPMSQGDTGSATERSLRELGARVAALPQLRDVDTPADLAAVAGSAPGSRLLAVAERVLGVGALR